MLSISDGQPNKKSFMLSLLFSSDVKNSMCAVCSVSLFRSLSPEEHQPAAAAAASWKIILVYVLLQQDISSLAALPFHGQRFVGS